MDERKEETLYKLAQTLLEQGKQASRSWQGVCSYVFPELVYGAHHQPEKAKDDLGRRICTRAKNNVIKFAAAHSAYITPSFQRWFSFINPVTPEWNDLWYTQAEEVMTDVLNSHSNFYSVLGQVYIDRVATGTGVMLVDIAPRGNLVSTHVPAGTYGLAENEQHVVDTLVRDFVFTAVQARDAFGEENLTREMKEALSGRNPGEAYEKKFHIWHIIVPRPGGVKHLGIASRQNLAFASYYLEPTEKKLLHEGGYYEFPALVTRFLKIGDQVYGTGVLENVKDTVKDLVVQGDALRKIAQISVMPPMVLPPDAEGQIDYRAGGQSVMSYQAMQAGFPHPLVPNPRYDIAIDIKSLMEKELDDACYISLLETVSSIDRYMTATEVDAREREKVLAFGTSFTQFIADATPLIEHIFLLLLRNGFIPMEGIPESMLSIARDGKNVEVRPPKVSFRGRIAQALERLQLNSTETMLQTFMTYVQQTNDPQYTDSLDIAEATRFILRKSGVPASVIRSREEVQAIQNQRAQMAQLQAEAAIAQQQAAANASNAQANVSNAQAEALQ